ncbi:MAG: bifunctional precorrin-2 dehydrogenase/sirohydrochlorin ferrochelatase [Nitrospira sp.]|nr:bifunctional precorrin-2 dehydrogenase/sirohydrochlorin ferrochelatase [Nitrospira sp.]
MANPGFPITLDVKGRLCVVLGGDEEASDKAQRLLDAGAKVTVVSPTLNDALRKLTAGAKVIHRVRLFRGQDADGACLVINTLRADEEFSRALYEQAIRDKFLLVSLDQPDYSNVWMPAVLSRGHLRCAISTSGVAPALASRLRQDLEQVFDDTFQSFMDWLASVRESLQEGESDGERRRTLLREAVDGFRLTAKIDYPKAWQNQKAK